MTELGVSRRNIICGFVAAGATVPLVAACGSSDGGSGGTAGGGPTSAGSTPTGAATTGGSAAGSIKTSEIPVGGGKIFADRSLIVTQPAAGEFKAFTSVCTHQGSNINKISGDLMVCPLHGSEFSIDDGSVERGPASQSLPEKTVTVSADGQSLEVSG